MAALRTYYVGLLLLLAATLLQLVLQLEGNVVCFKKFRKRRGDCKRPLKKQIYTTSTQCCSGRGSGWSWTSKKIGINSYRCTSCESRNTLTTPYSVAISTLAPWGEWSGCTVTCGAGWRSKYRQCPTCDVKDYRNKLFQPCMVRSYCPVDGNWGPWFQWQRCSRSCGGGVRNRTRSCIYPPPAYGGKDCEGKHKSFDKCNTKPCKVDGAWGSWMAWSSCSESCGFGNMKRIRKCDNPQPRYKGKSCEGTGYQMKKCENKKCPQRGGWSLWSSWKPCPVTCGTGYRIRNRECNSPKPMHGGDYCKGPKNEKYKCRGRRACPVSIHGSWSNWSEFGNCKARRCSGIRGLKYRHRTCTNPKPRHYGRTCRGRSHERRECYNNVDCPVDGNWCNWGPWSACSQSNCSLSTSIERRKRECSCPKPQFNGADCPDGPAWEVRKCSTQPYCSKAELFSSVSIQATVTKAGRWNITAEPANQTDTMCTNCTTPIVTPTYMTDANTETGSTITTTTTTIITTANKKKKNVTKKRIKQP